MSSFTLSKLNFPDSYSMLNRNTFTNIRRLRDKTKVKKYFAIDDTHRGLVVQISPNMLSGIIYAGMQI